MACLSWKKRTRLSFFMHSLRTATELRFRKKVGRQSWSGLSAGRLQTCSHFMSQLMCSADGSVKLSLNAAAEVSANCIRKKILLVLESNWNHMVQVEPDRRGKILHLSITQQVVYEQHSISQRSFDGTIQLKTDFLF